MRFRNIERKKQWNVILKKIKVIAFALMSPVVERVSVANVLLITGGWVNSPDAYSLMK